MPNVSNPTWTQHLQKQHCKQLSTGGHGTAILLALLLGTEVRYVINTVIPPCQASLLLSPLAALPASVPASARTLHAHHLKSYTHYRFSPKFAGSGFCFQAKYALYSA